MLKGVIYIPHLTRNLFLVKQTTIQEIVTFFDEDVFIMIEKNVNGLQSWMDGHLDGKMQKLNAKVISLVEFMELTKTQVTFSVNHKRTKSNLVLCHE